MCVCACACIYRAISANNFANTKRRNTCPGKKQLGGAILGCSEDLLASVRVASHACNLPCNLP